MADGVIEFAPGDEVFGNVSGAFAEFVRGSAFVHKPADLSFEQAAAVPLAACTALQAVRDRGEIKPGQRVLINGAGGGVGSFAVQIAKALGGHVTATSNGDKLDMLRAIGADEVIDYTRQDFTRSGQRYDLIVDLGGTPSLRACLRALAPGGTFVIVGAGKGWLGVLGRMVAAALRSLVLRQRVRLFVADVTIPDLLTLRQLIEEGKLRPVIDRTYALSDIADAIRYVESERARGKIVIRVDEAG